MNKSIFRLSLAFALAGAATLALAQQWQPPAREQRCPSKWGASDERGAANHMKPEKLLRTSKLIRSGVWFELGRTLSADMPFFGTRRFSVTTKRTTGTMGSNLRRSNEELVDTEIGQVGTQFDAFPHQTIGNDLYNCVNLEEAATRNGFTKLGVENVGTLFTRGVLFDIAALKGVDALEPSYEITAADLQAALKRQNLALEPGDAALIHTGWGKLWGVDNAKYMASAPGIGISAADWLAKQDVMLIGSDNFGVEIAPNPDKAISLPVHQITLVVNGIYLLENLKLDELAANKVHEFALVLQPLKIKGGTGSTVAPVAIR